jgi:hypothetical protein
MSDEKQIVPVKERAPVLAGDRGLQFTDMDSMYRFCVAVVNSRQFKDIDTPENALIRLQAGLELGLTPIWSLVNIMVTNGRPAVWGDGLLGLVLNHKDCEDVIETFEGVGDDLTAVCEVHRKGRLPVKREFGVRDAKRAGLFGKNVHNSYPSRMLQMRARSWACRDAFADALRGLGIIEELRDIEPKMASARTIERPKLVLPDEPVGDYFQGNVKDQPHPWMPATGSEGRCELCGLGENVVIHSQFEKLNAPEPSFTACDWLHEDPPCSDPKCWIHKRAPKQTLGTHPTKTDELPL